MHQGCCTLGKNCASSDRSQHTRNSVHRAPKMFQIRLLSIFKLSKFSGKVTASAYMIKKRWLFHVKEKIKDRSFVRIKHSRSSSRHYWDEGQVSRDAFWIMQIFYQILKYIVRGGMQILLKRTTCDLNCKFSFLISSGSSGDKVISRKFK